MFNAPVKFGNRFPTTFNFSTRSNCNHTSVTLFNASEWDLGDFYKSLSIGIRKLGDHMPSKVVIAVANEVYAPYTTEDSPPVFEHWLMYSPDVVRFNQIWVVISAWLTQLGSSTQRTYLGIIAEYCGYLGFAAGSEGAANAIIRTMPVEGVAYYKFLERSRGETPRGVRKSHQLSKRRDGYQSTLANSTIRKKIICLRKMYDVVISHGIRVERNPFSKNIVTTPSKGSGEKRPTQMIPFQDVPKILSSVPDSIHAVRDRAILAVLFGAGLRRGELVQLRLNDVKRSDTGTYYLQLKFTKSGVDQVAALPSWAVEKVIQQIDSRKAIGATGADYLFNGYTGRGGTLQTNRPISTSGIYLIFLSACNNAGLPPGYTPHSARATAITKLLADGIPHREVQEFSRHKSIEMVEHYDKRRFGVDKSPAKGLKY